MVFFVDAAHFVFKAYLGFLWCFARVIIRSPSGRKRYNVLGALNALTHQLITVTNETYITAESVCELLQKIAALGIQAPITIILDNTRYQRCAKVMETAAALQIELLFLPPYSPNLNLIEERPTDYTWRRRQPQQQHPNLPSVPSFGGSDRRSGPALSSKG